MTDTPKRPVTAQDLLGLRIPGSLAVDPEGRRIALTVAESDFDKSEIRTQLHLAPDPAAPPGRAAGHPRADLRARRRDPTGLVARRPDAGVRHLPPAAARGGGGRPARGRHRQEAGLHPSRRRRRGPPPDRGRGGGRAVPLDARRVGCDLPRPRAAPRRRARLAPPAPRPPRRPDRRPRRRAGHQIWIQPLDGAPRRVLGGVKGLDDFDISPDGKWLAYSANFTGLPDDAERMVVVLRAIESGEERRAGNGRGGAESTPTFTSTGSTCSSTAGPSRRRSTAGRSRSRSTSRGPTRR